MAVRELTEEERARELARRAAVAGGSVEQIAREFVKANGAGDLAEWVYRFEAALAQPALAPHTPGLRRWG